ncbi:FAD-dependent thymidylate synthase [Sporosarcina psychrophila]|uniref:FAD-dependent thymidylate synthase n=1 Tax=Sporosarcina psychrophila TaxID=1476 RepID=A0ABV2KBP2_SPOPS
MTQTQRKVTLIAHTQLSKEFRSQVSVLLDDLHFRGNQVTDGQAVALTAIRTCYSPNKPSEIVAKEGARYFGKKATDGEGGTEADRLIRFIMRSGHTSTTEHISFTFAIEGVSRALLAQLTRHRVGFSFSVQSQRYVRFGSGDKSGGFDYVLPDSARDNGGAEAIFKATMAHAQSTYDYLRKNGVPSEDARAVLPNAAACNLVLTGNLRSIIEFYGKRKAGNGAQAEIAGLAEDLRAAVVKVEPWTGAFFEGGRK